MINVNEVAITFFVVFASISILIISISVCIYLLTMKEDADRIKVNYNEYQRMKLELIKFKTFHITNEFRIMDLGNEIEELKEKKIDNSF